MLSTPPKDDITDCIKETASLWKKRRIAVDAPYFTLHDLAYLDDCLNAQLNTLNQSSARSWKTLEQRLSSPQYQLDELFPAAALAFTETAPTHQCDFLLAFVEKNEQHITALIEALSWLPLDNFKKYLLQFLESPNPLHQRIAIATCAWQRSDVGHYLDNALTSDDPSLRLCALKAAGELGRLDLLPELQKHLNSNDPEQGFWAVWSATRLGDRGTALEILKVAASAAFPWRMQALKLASRLFDPNALFPWLHVNAPKENPELTKIAISTVGTAGYARCIPWLIEQMHDAELARSAGEAFTFITGIDIAEQKLGTPAPNKSLDDPTRGLPWPDADTVNAWWQTHHAQYPEETRCLLGRPITPEHCLHVLVNGYQRQRAAAALELALIQTGMPLFAIHAPAAEQQDLLNVRDTLQTCVETAAELWLERDQAAHAPMTTLDELTDLDSRLEQQLTLLREAGDLGCKCCMDYLAEDRPGRVFVAAATAVAYSDDAVFHRIVNYVEAAPELIRELIAALGWVAPRYLKGKVQDLLASHSPLSRYAGVAACNLHRVDPGRHLDTLLKDSGLRLRAYALRTVGELRIQRHLPVLRQHLGHPNEQWRFWAAWSASLLSESNGLKELRKNIEQHKFEFSLQQYAIDLIARSMEPEAARVWIRQLLLDEKLIYVVIRGLGMLGDPTAIPWLIRRMAGSLEEACLSGEAFSRITGVDLVQQGLVLNPLEATDFIEKTDGKSSKAIDFTSQPCPDPQAVNQWWNEKQSRYKRGRCYLMGFPINVEVCWQVLLHGPQFQRVAAALELALLETQTALFPVEAPGFRQWEWLSAVRTQMTVSLGSNDEKSTIPQSFSSHIDPVEGIGPLRGEISGMSSYSQPDQSVIDTMNGLAELTRPVTHRYLFHRKALLESQQKKITLDDGSSLIEDRSQTFIEESGQQILLANPTPITVRTARNILETRKIHPTRRVVNRSVVADQYHNTMIQPVETLSLSINSESRDIIDKEVIDFPSTFEYERCSISLSPVTFEWYFNRIAEVWYKNYTIVSGRYTLFSHLVEADNYLRPYIDYLPEISDKLWNTIGILEDKWEVGHLFAASLIALKDGCMKRIRRVVSVAVNKLDISQGFLSALDWLAPSLAKEQVRALLNSKYVEWRRLGMMAVLANHIECKDSLLKLLNDSDEHVKPMAIKAVGKLAYKEYLPLLMRFLNDSDENCQFWAAWSAVLLGNRQIALERLKGFVVSTAAAPQRQCQALSLILRISNIDDIRRWVLIAAQHNRHLYTKILEVGACRNIFWVPLLVEMIGQPECARIAGEAFTNLTGVDLINEGFMRPRVVEHSRSHCYESAELMNFFIPDHLMISSWWSSNNDRYNEDKDYFFGREVTLQNCLWVLENGRQYQRLAAALEIGLLKDDLPFFETNTSSFQQRRFISQLQLREAET